jgi:hypothetical protein
VISGNHPKTGALGGCNQAHRFDPEGQDANWGVLKGIVRHRIAVPMTHSQSPPIRAFSAGYSVLHRGGERGGEGAQH